MIVSIESKEDLIFPDSCIVWITKINDKLLVNSDAILSPQIEIYPDIRLNGKWVVYDGYKVTEIDENGNKKILKNSIEDKVVRYVYAEDGLIPIYKSFLGFTFGNEKFDEYKSKYGFIMLLNGKRARVILPYGQFVDVEHPKFYKIFRDHVDLIYDNETLIIYRDGRRERYKGEKYLIALTSVGRVFLSPNGRILLDSSAYDLMGICTEDMEFIGETRNGIIISCGNKLKSFYRGGWSYIGSFSYLPVIDADYNHISINDGNVVNVYELDSDKSSKLFNVRALKFKDGKIILISKSGTVFKLSFSKDTDFLKIINDKNSVELPYIIRIDKKIASDFSLSKNLIDVEKVADGDGFVLKLEPFKLSNETEGSITFKEEIFEYQFPLKVFSDLPDIEVESGHIIMAKNGHLKTDPSSNAILKLKMRFKIPSLLRKSILIDVGNKKTKVDLDRSVGELDLSIPFFKLSLDEEVVKISVLRDNRVELKKEFIVKTNLKMMSKNSKKTSYAVIQDMSKRTYKVYNDDLFSWEEFSEEPNIYENIYYAKVGDKLQIEDKIIEVKDGLNQVKVERPNYSRTYFIYGVSNPLRDLKVTLKESDVIFDLVKDEDSVVTVIYGTNYVTTKNNKIKFSIDPAYNTIIIRSYKEGIRFETSYMLVDFFRNCMLKAVVNAKYLAQQLFLE
ncbi:protein UpsX [Sulfolobus acidocaldarius]|uniref:Uncharacterized protein n=3 Tax=Sulfolobus acidocaldarius TaxID=2285 RepID=A0A0U3GPW7_9CREN|nr:hypothetical protein [Sulfolobus acidocaldarius]AGE71413.1 hypothetical protein SacN8_07245 [Sulfolobus acidocaldarius N8]AGE73685.1 hypothetical protein SacRon12I_07250 [Sulfolobus acidocaldarius Ron12/I]ALU30344.1 hypothetical protein ATY89_10585 [Sulfolobus acidocaldarius]ALU31062.1 hypothetical protein ATZ20_02140 [Sulfolobus acidocaldarius]WCM35323.1 hypothetical protein GO597_08305 [Sulfolobus acidocaldarius DSM 639]